MRTEPTGKSPRVWLSERERDRIVNHYDEEPVKRLAIWLMAHGLRAHEALKVAKNHFRQLDTGDEVEAFVLRVRNDTKTGIRETPVSADLRSLAKTIANISEKNKDESLIDVTEKTVGRWVEAAAVDIADETGNDDWKKVTAHDLRRTWATHTYYSLSGERAREVVMSWGGWEDTQTFVSSYLGKPTDGVTYDMMQEAGLC